MAYILDVAGSTIFAGVLIVMMIAHNVNVVNASRELMQKSISQSEAIEAGRIFDYDLYKMGYRVSDQNVLLADSTRLRYAADVDNNGTVDTVYYYLGADLMTSTENPNDRPVYRVLNGSSPAICMVVTDFKLAYFDSVGNKLSHTALVNASERAKIRTLRGNVRFESPHPMEGEYQSFVLSRTIRPKNL